MSDPLRRVADLRSQHMMALRWDLRHAFMLAVRLRRFSYGVIVLTLVMTATLLITGLTGIALRLVVIWAATFCLLVGMRVLMKRTEALIRSPLRLSVLRPISSVFCVAVSGFAGVAGAFTLAGVPVVGSMVLIAAAVSTAFVVLAGAR